MSICLIVANPVAGGVSPELVDRVAQRCAAAGAAAGTQWTTAAGSATAQVAAAVTGATPPQLVIAVGGDGTVREAAEGLARGLGRWDGAATADGPALVIVPAGTGNSVHRALWADRPWDEVLDVCLGSVFTGRPGAGRSADAGAGSARKVTVRHLDLARIVGADRAVLLGASSGFIAEVTAAARDFLHVPGRERYHQALARVLADFRPYPGRVLLDGKLLHEGPTTMATVGGGRHRVGAFEVLPRSVLDDGLLDVCVVDGDLDDTYRAELAGQIMAGAHVGGPGITYAQGRRITIERTDGEPVTFEHDGELWRVDGAAVTLAVVPSAVPACAPVEPVAG